MCSSDLFEEHPRVPEFKAAWLEGYREVAPLAAEDEAELDRLDLAPAVLRQVDEVIDEHRPGQARGEPEDEGPRESGADPACHP